MRYGFESHTPGALIACSSEDLNSRKKDKCNDNLQNSSQSQSQTISNDKEKETIKQLIISICKYQKPYIKNSLIRLLERSSKNAEIICKYTITEQNEINIKELTKEGKIKTLVDLSKLNSLHSNLQQANQDTSVSGISSITSQKLPNYDVAKLNQPIYIQSKKSEEVTQGLSNLLSKIDSKISDLEQIKTKKSSMIGI